MDFVAIESKVKMKVDECNVDITLSYCSKPRYAAPRRRGRCNASTTAAGLWAATCNNARAGPSGIRRPCSQFLSVAPLTPIMSANADCDWPRSARTAFTSVGLNVTACAPRGGFHRAGVRWPTALETPLLSLELLAYHAYHACQRADLCRRQIALLVLRVHVHHVAQVVIDGPIIDRADAAALSTSFGAPAQLSQAGTTGNEHSLLGRRLSAAPASPDTARHQDADGLQW